MSGERGDRAAPPPRPGGYALRFATNDAAKGWEELCRQAAPNTRAACEAIETETETEPCTRPPSPRHHQLKGQFVHRYYAGRVLAQGQYEVTGGGRIWYLVDHDARTCWINEAGTGHPKATD